MRRDRAERPHRLTESTHDREHQADRAARKLGNPADRAPGSGNVDDVRRRVEQWSGHDLSGVQVHEGRQGNALGSTDGQRITVDPAIARSPQFADHVLLHEFVHAAQVEESAALEGTGERRRPQPLQMYGCEGCGTDSVPTPKPGSKLDPLSTGKKVTATEAEAALKMYESAPAGARDKIVAKFHTAGNASAALRRLIDALPPDVKAAKMSVIDDLLRRLQTQTVMASTGQSMADMGKTQGTWREKKATAAAAAKAAADAKKKGLPPPKAPPTAAQVEKAETASIKADSLQPPNTKVWVSMTKAQQATWNTKAAAVIAKVVVACNRRAPELKISAANITFDAQAIEDDAADIMAFSGDPITVGLYFIETAIADEEYVVATVIHEIVGHPEYVDGPEWDIHKESLKTFPTKATVEVQEDLYNYLGTELHSVLREYEYYKPVSKVHKAAGIEDQDPTFIVTKRLQVLKSNYEPSIAAALLLGMWDRFRTDPRITTKGLALFKREAASVMPGVKLP